MKHEWRLLTVIGLGVGMLFLLGAGGGGEATEHVSEAVHHTASVAVPKHFGWLTTALLGIMWLFIAAMLLGPVVAKFAKPLTPEAAHHGDGHGDGHGHGDSHGHGGH